MIITGVKCLLQWLLGFSPSVNEFQCVDHGSVESNTYTHKFVVQDGKDNDGYEYNSGNYSVYKSSGVIGYFLYKNRSKYPLFSLRGPTIIKREQTVPFTQG